MADVRAGPGPATVDYPVEVRPPDIGRYRDGNTGIPYYSSFDSGFGAEVEAGKLSFEDLEKIALQGGEPVLKSGRQEMLENIFNEFL